MNDRPIRSAADWRAQHRAGSPPKILTDPAVKALVDELLPNCTFNEISQRCRERFGDRAPCKSAVHRYWRRLTDPDGPNIAPEGPVHDRAGECLYCGTPLKKAAQRPFKRFCTDAHRNLFHSAARAFVTRAVISGQLSRAELRQAGAPQKPIEE